MGRASKRRPQLKTLKLKVPTYNANYFPREVEEGTKQEFGKPLVPVVIHSADGVRVVLGTHRYMDCDKPDIMIERQPNGWVIFLHSVGGGDPCGYVYFLDDGAVTCGRKARSVMTQ